jgi:hypothetical protein
MLAHCLQSLAAKLKGKPAYPDLDFCTISTAKERSVSIRFSASVEEARVVMIFLTDAFSQVQVRDKFFDPAAQGLAGG